MEILTEENLVGARTAPTAISRTVIPLVTVRETRFLSKDSLLPPRMRWKIGRRWGWGSNRDPDFFKSQRAVIRSAAISQGRVNHEVHIVN